MLRVSRSSKMGPKSWDPSAPKGRNETIKAKVFELTCRYEVSSPLIVRCKPA